jgi:protein-S-isoprenylcysteine O-methyltransferase Ste14
MNWYRFKVELFSWVAKVALCTLTSVMMIAVLFEPDAAIRSYPLALRSVAENDWVFPVLFIAFTALLWLCYWKVTREFRSRNAYGQR